MAYEDGFPRQRLPFRRKTEKWARGCVDWADGRTYFNYAPVRKDVVNMKVNYDLLRGRVHMEDMAALLNPYGSVSMDDPDRVQHYPIMDAYLYDLRGEAGARPFPWRAVVTNPDSVGESERERGEAMLEALRGIVEDGSVGDGEARSQAREAAEWYMHDWQDFREKRANELLRHYSMEQDFKDVFLEGFMDAMAVGEEAYQCDIVGGEPVLVRLNPMKLRVFRSGWSSRIEDADVVVYEDWWSPGRIIDSFYDRLTPGQVSWLEGGPGDPQSAVHVGAAGNEDAAWGLYDAGRILGEEGVWDDGAGVGRVLDGLADMAGGVGSDLSPYDVAGNVRVLRVYWKSRRKVLKVKRYDPETGDEEYDFYPEGYVLDEAAGEEAEEFWVNEPWEGTKIGRDIYVDLRPRPVRFNTLDNPSRCHFGIVGTIYNLNEGRPYSLVDMMKPYNYLYDAVHAKLVELIATNWGKLLEMDLALKPKDWEVDKWLYFARVNKVLIKDSFNEGEKGAATGRLAGGLNNATKGVVDADWGASIQNYLSLLEVIDSKMAKLIGMTPQRMGQVQNRETVGGVERATLQSSYITDWLFQKHDNTVRRVLTAFLETAKAALRGRTKKFQYMLSDGSVRVMDVDGDEFAESDYGIVVDGSSDTQRFDQQVEGLAQAAVQNGVMDFASVMKLYRSASLAEKVRMVEGAERRARERAEGQRREAQEAQQRLEQSKAQAEEAKMRHEDALNRRDNETKVRVAEINSKAEWLRFGQYADDGGTKESLAVERERISEGARQFDAQLALKERELAQRRELEDKKIQASREKAGRTNGGTRR